MYSRRAVAAGLAALLSAAPAGAATAGAEGADFLRLPAGARPAALGGAYDALADDPYAPAYNPAGLGHARAAGVSATYLSYLQSASYDSLSAAVPLRGRDGARTGHGLGASIQYFSPGSVAGTDALGNSTGRFDGHYLSAELAYGRAVTRRLALGLGAKLVTAKIASASGSAYAGDLGAMFLASDRVSLSAVAANLGGALKFLESSDPLPRQYRAGAAVKALPSLLLAAQGLYEEGGPGLSAGAEWSALAPLVVRGGYQTTTARGLGAEAGVSLGIGLRWKRIGFDYAWQPMGGLGTTSFFSLVIGLGRDDGAGLAGGAAQ